MLSQRFLASIATAALTASLGFAAPAFSQGTPLQKTAQLDTPDDAGSEPPPDYDNQGAPDSAQDMDQPDDQTSQPDEGTGQPGDEMGQPPADEDTGPQATGAETLFDNNNPQAVANSPWKATTFTLSAPAQITRIMTYHWNHGSGAPAGEIGIQNLAGRSFGSWQAQGEQGQGGVSDAYWIVEPNITLPAGTYRVIDSDPGSWAQNAASGGAGIATVEGNSQ